MLGERANDMGGSGDRSSLYNLAFAGGEALACVNENHAKEEPRREEPPECKKLHVEGQATAQVAAFAQGYPEGHFGRYVIYATRLLPMYVMRQWTWMRQTELGVTAPSLYRSPGFRPEQNCTEEPHGCRICKFRLTVSSSRKSS